MKKKRVPVDCTCGTRLVSQKAYEHHIGSAWHKIAVEARKLRKLDMSYTEIARQFPHVSRQLIWSKLKEEKL